MDPNSLSLMLIPILGIGALGVYLLLAPGDGGSGKLERWIGAALTSLSLVTLSLAVGRPVQWWPESILESGVLWALFTLLACSSIVSAVFTITCRPPTHAVLWFALLILSNAGLYVFLGAPFLGVVTILVYAGVIAVAYLFLSRRAERQLAEPTERIGREPLLACVTGVLFSIALVGTLHFAFVAEAKHTVAAEEKRDIGSLRRSAMPRQSHEQTAVAPDYHLLNNSLIGGALLFALGTIGFLTQRNLVVMILAAGMMLQGVTLTLTAFGMFHGNWSGQVFAFFALAVTAVEGALALVLIAAVVREASP